MVSSQNLARIKKKRETFDPKRMTIIYCDLPLDRLYPIVKRDAAFYAKFPEYEEMVELLVKDIDANGLKYPICVLNVKDNGKYQVSIGCQRLEALKRLGVSTVKCLVMNKVKHKKIPDGEVVQSKEQLLSYFGGEVYSLRLQTTAFEVRPIDVTKYDPIELRKGK